MTKKEEKKFFWSYVNPLLWLKTFFSYFFTGALVVNHFFVAILICIVFVLVVFFLYDRYALMTYDEDYMTEYATSFGSSKKYNSPFAKGDKDLMRDLHAYYGYKNTSTRTERRSRVEEKQIQDDFDDTYVIRQEQPVWDRQDVVPRSFIYQEVRHRLMNIEKNVMKKGRK